MQKYSANHKLKENNIKETKIKITAYKTIFFLFYYQNPNTHPNPDYTHSGRKQNLLGKHVANIDQRLQSQKVCPLQNKILYH